ncbi:MAG: hypothetical protein WC627_11960 [Legionella sp.]|jgi:chromosome segregation ATPase
MTKPTEFKSTIIPIIQKLNFNYQYLSDPYAYNFKELDNAISESRSLLFKLNKKLEELDYDPGELLETVSNANDLIIDFESYLDEADKALNSKINKANKIDENFNELNLNLQQLHSEWKQTIADSNENIRQLKDQINVVTQQSTSHLKDVETNYRTHLKENETNYLNHLKELEQQYIEYCSKIKNDQDNKILSIKNKSNTEIKSIKKKIIDWETKLRESRSKWKTLKTQIETMKKNKEQI